MYKKRNRRNSEFRDHRLKGCWYNMNSRCNNPKNPRYYAYGGRGVKVCWDWHFDNPKGLANFIRDMYPSYKEGLSIDKDKLGNGFLYSKETCCWLTIKEQSKYRRAKTVKKPVVDSNAPKTRKISKRNSSGITGVSWRKTLRKWEAVITIKKKRLHLGLFTNFEDAAQARLKAEKDYLGVKI